MANHNAEGLNTASPAFHIPRVTASGLQELLSLSPDALVMIDRTGTIIQANDQTASCFGFTLQELIGAPVEHLLPDALREIHTRHRDHYFAAPRQRTMGSGLPLFGQRKDGSHFPIDISLRPVHLDTDLLVIAAVRDVSEQRQAERERELQSHQLRLQGQLLDLAHDAILVRDAAGQVLFWNKGAEQLYGWNADQARGQVTHTLLQTVFPISLTRIDEQLAREGYWEGELVHTCQDGQVVIVESRQALVRDFQPYPLATLEINRNITRRRELEQQAQEAHAETLAHLAFFQQVIDALPSSIYLVYGQQARLLLANRAAQSVWGALWERDQPMGAFLAEKGIRITNAQGRPMDLQDLATVRAVQQGEVVRHLQETVRRPDQTSLPVLVNAVVLDAPHAWQLLRPDGGRSAPHPSIERIALIVHQDVSVLKEAEQLKDAFIGIAAHELRNPLGALKGFSSMLTYQSTSQRGPVLADWQREALSEIEQATDRLDKLTEDLLDVTRLQAGRFVLSRATTDLVSLVQQQVRLAQITTQKHILSVETALAELLVEIDCRRIEQVLSNLLSNAIKYSPQGGPITIHLRLERPQSSALLSVRDQGIGIPVEQQGKLFGRFVRAENARTTEISGTGLGLHLSRALVEHHGGQLWFESVEGAGSTFFMRLPLS